MGREERREEEKEGLATQQSYRATEGLGCDPDGAWDMRTSTDRERKESGEAGTKEKEKQRRKLVNVQRRHQETKEGADRRRTTHAKNPQRESACPFGFARELAIPPTT